MESLTLLTCVHRACYAACNVTVVEGFKAQGQYYIADYRALPLRASTSPAKPDTVMTPILGRKPGGGSLKKLYASATNKNEVIYRSMNNLNKQISR